MNQWKSLIYTSPFKSFTRILGYYCDEYEIHIDTDNTTGEKLFTVISLTYELQLYTKKMYSSNDVLKPLVWMNGNLSFVFHNRNASEVVQILRNVFTVIPPLDVKQNEEMEQYIFVYCAI